MSVRWGVLGEGNKYPKWEKYTGVQIAWNVVIQMLSDTLLLLEFCLIHDLLSSLPYYFFKFLKCLRSTHESAKESNCKARKKEDWVNFAQCYLRTCLRWYTNLCFTTVLQGITSAIKWVYKSIGCIKRFQIAGWREWGPCQTHCVQTQGVQNAEGS